MEHVAAHSVSRSHRPRAVARYGRARRGPLAPPQRARRARATRWVRLGRGQLALRATTIAQFGQFPQFVVTKNTVWPPRPEC